ncbi:MAG: nitrilase-related carbon-nitrogen hydrolase [Odoribacter splanchnicus]
MIIAIPQLNYKAGDIQGNSEKIISAIQKAQNQKAELILFPELAVSGALPQDLLRERICKCLSYGRRKNRSHMYSNCSYCRSTEFG